MLEVRMTHQESQEMDAPMGTDVGVKSLAALGFLVKETGADLYALMKMLYLADKAHLTAYGRTVTGDGHLAMRHGPVPTVAYQMWCFVRKERDHFDHMPDARAWFEVSGNHANFKRAAPLEYLSRSDIECLAEAALKYKKGGWRAVYHESHDAAWTKVWNGRPSGRKVADMSLMTIAESIGDAALVSHLADSAPGTAELATG